MGKGTDLSSAMTRNVNPPSTRKLYVWCSAVKVNLLSVGQLCKHCRATALHDLQDLINKGMRSSELCSALQSQEAQMGV